MDLGDGLPVSSVVDGVVNFVVFSSVVFVTSSVALDVVDTLLRDLVTFLGGLVVSDESVVVAERVVEGVGSVVDFDSVGSEGCLVVLVTVDC